MATAATGTASPAAPAAKTVATQLFQDFKTNQIVNQNYDPFLALSRAVRIFLISFREYERMSPQLYQQKFVEYMDAIQTLYGFQNFDSKYGNQTVVATELSSLRSEKIKITIGVKLFKGRKQVTNPRINITNGAVQSDWIPLNTDKSLQTNVQYSQIMTFDHLVNNRRRRTDVVIILEADDWKMSWSELNVFSISYDQIPAEGYEDWFYFGRGVRLLIKIDYKAVDQTDKRMASTYHLHTIIYMIRKRLQNYRTLPNVRPTHRRFGHRYKVSYIRKKVEQITDEAFWSVPITPQNILQSIQSFVDTNEGEDNSRIKSLFNYEVKFNDLQIGYRFTDSFDDNVCLCSEWCNWNSFFYYNPIYRFLMIQNNNIFLESRTNVADIYLFASTFCAYEAGLNVPPNQSFPLTPILRLMNCANNYRTLLKNTFFMTDLQFKAEYNTSYPDIECLNGLTYNLLRNHINLPELWLQSDVNPFSEVCLDNICIFYSLYCELHVWCSTRSSLVSQLDNKEWFKELDKTCRKPYKIYIKLSYDKRMANKLISYDYLFTEDYEYSNKMWDKRIKSIRYNVLKLGPNDNLFNVRVIYNDLLSTFVSVYKFIQIVDPFLPLSKYIESAVAIFQCFKALDTDFNAFIIDSEFDFKFDEQLIARRNLEHMREVFTVFFTLKLYSVAFGIQSYCIKSVIRVKLRAKIKPEQAFSEFNFIWKSTLFEQQLRKDYPNSALFEINANIEQSFDEFYGNFWGRADHELNKYSPYAPNIASAYFQYQRLYFWWRNDGNNRYKFRAVIDSFTNAIYDILKRSEDIYSTYIMPSIISLSQTYVYHLEVMDVLVQYLVKADCYMILNSIAIFMRKVHSLPVPTNVSRKVSYVMSKPGWVPLFRTMRTCLQYVEELQSLYIVFDDEFDKISVIFEETKRMVKEIYRDYYKKLTNEWLQEIDKLGVLRNLYPSSEEFISMHLAVGLSFMAAFINDFRKVSRFHRIFLFDLLDYQSNEPHQQILNNFYAICENYLTDPQIIQTATPLLWPLWQQEMAAVDFNQLDQMTEQDVQIDLNAANS